MTLTSSASSSAQKYSELVAAIVKVVPDIKVELLPPFLMRQAKTASEMHAYRPITLEDVLRALQRREDDFVTTVNQQGEIRTLDSYGEPQRGADWHLGAPLSDQSDETKDFLHSLLAAMAKIRTVRG